MINVQVNGVLVKSDVKDIIITDDKLILDGVEVVEFPEKRSKSYVFLWLAMIINCIVMYTLTTKFSAVYSLIIFFPFMIVNFLNGIEATRNKS